MTLDNFKLSSGGFSDDDKKVSTKTLVGTAVALAVLFATVYVVGKAWRTSQKA
jgi:hypothetical protein